MENRMIIDINAADEAMLMQLKGIGEARAKAICDYRSENGPFSRIEDILSVSGIGQKTFEQIKDNITAGQVQPQEE